MRDRHLTHNPGAPCAAHYGAAAAVYLLAAYEDVNADAVTVWIKDVVVARKCCYRVAAFAADDGHHVVIVCIDHTKHGRRTANSEVEVVVARVVPDFIGAAHLRNDL